MPPHFLFAPNRAILPYVRLASERVVMGKDKDQDWEEQDEKPEEKRQEKKKDKKK
jgi:hypothetical protein